MRQTQIFCLSFKYKSSAVPGDNPKVDMVVDMVATPPTAIPARQRSRRRSGEIELDTALTQAELDASPALGVKMRSASGGRRRSLDAGGGRYYGRPDGSCRD